MIGHTPDYKGVFPDKRLDERARLISQALLSSKTSSINATTENEKEQKGFYRFLANERVTEQALVKELTTRCASNVTDKDVVVIEDTTSIGLSQYSNSIKALSGLGLVGNKTGLGFLSHCSLVIDADTEAMLGFSDVQVWHRTEDKANNTTRAYKKQPIEEKESNKWMKGSLNSKEVLSSARSITIIQDREGDIYQQFCAVPDEKTNLLIRCRDNRKLVTGKKLYETLAGSPVLGEYSIPIYGDVRKEKIKRTAIVEVRAIPVSIQKPSSLKDEKLPASIDLYAVEVKEKEGSYNGKDALCWRILTTKKTETLEEAVSVIDKYKVRWYIEQLFRLLKKQGYQIESSQLESGWAIRKLFLLVLNTALRWMQLYLAYDVEESQPVTDVFNEGEIKCLKNIESKYLDKTQHTNNPFNQQKLSWASWIIARLGGWKGNIKQRKAGPITIKRGLEKFQIMYEGWKLVHEDT
jgi:hypothetical protein